MKLIARAAGAVWLGVTLLAAARPVSAQQPAQQRPDCSAPEHRQFDFWVGEWAVTAPNGSKAGENRISLILKNCVLLEEWSGAGGGFGKSYNVYDRTTRKWHQTWVDDSGTLLQLDGGLVDGAMVLEGSTLSRTSATVMHRVQWSKIGESPDRVRQFWQQSTDGGKTWSTAFDGTYTRKSDRD